VNTAEMRFGPLALAAALLAGALLAAPGGATAARAGGNWRVVLAAGDRAQPVFDNATRAFAAFLVAQGVPAANIHRLTASEGELAPGVDKATKAALLHQISVLPARRGDRCLVFLTSHGTRDKGIYLAVGDDVLTPDELSHALAQGCGRVPTVTIVSACYSGIFADAAMQQPNRVVMTAARADRPSFGCQAERTYTFFDECVLGALPKAGTWQTLYDQAGACVHQMEEQLKETPSDPQAFFGSTVRKLPLLFRKGPTPRAGARDPSLSVF
jgi:hypothetical protein